MLVPTTGAVPAQTTCAYGVCPAAMGSGNTTWEVLLILLIVVALALGVLILRSRRRRPGGGSGPPDEWSPGTAGSVGPAEELAPAGALGAVGGSMYQEQPEDVGQVPPEMPAMDSMPPAAPAGEGDIDSLVAELDKIGQEILTRGPKVTKPTPPSSGEDEGTEPPA